MNSPPDSRGEEPGSSPPAPQGRKDLGGLYHGLQFAITAIGGLAVGYWLDQRWLPAPLGTLGGLFVGSVAGMVILARSMK